MLRPPRLRKGATIGFVAPSSPQRDDERLRSGIRYFESLGYGVKLGENLWKRYGYLAGTDEERASDLNAMIRDPEVKMIIAGRGGYGVTRILHMIDYRALKRNPKIIVGFSDVTALTCALFVKTGLVTFSGAMAGVDFWNHDAIDPLAEETFWRSVTSVRPLGGLSPDPSCETRTLRRGSAEGPLLCGNLTMLASIIGTPYFPKMRSPVLLIEEIGEEAYRVDRLLSQMWNSGVLAGASALAFGAFTNAKPTRVSVEPLPMEEVFAEYVRRSDIPTVAGVPYGHIPRKATVPFGVRARVDGARGVLRVLEAGVE